jgi:hypothetical protein
MVFRPVYAGYNGAGILYNTIDVNNKEFGSVRLNIVYSFIYAAQLMHQKREHRHKTGLKQRQSVLELKQAVC